MEIQVGISATADFEENTWTFEMENDFSVKAGKFAIIDELKFDGIKLILEQSIDHIGNDAKFASVKEDLQTVLNILK